MEGGSPWAGILAPGPDGCSPKFANWAEIFRAQSVSAPYSARSMDEFFFFWRGPFSLRRLLVGLFIGAVIWCVIAGASGYGFNKPASVSLCGYSEMKVDFVIPMYKANACP